MWDLIVSVPDDCLAFYSAASAESLPCLHTLQEGL